jgi:TDG/mug DNA glycosylase family protein
VTRRQPPAIGVRPTRDELARAAGRTIPDVLEPGLRVLFVGINPGLYSAAAGHHFARPGNRFWRALAGAAFTDRVLDPAEDVELPRFGLGVTNLVPRSTAGAAELGAAELRDGARRLREKVERFAPAFVAVLGFGAYRTAFDRPAAVGGRQAESLGGAVLWLLPNPSGLNANHQLPDLVERFADLRTAAGITDATARVSDPASPSASRRPGSDRGRSRSTRRSPSGTSSWRRA